MMTLLMRLYIFLILIFQAQSMSEFPTEDFTNSETAPSQNSTTKNEPEKYSSQITATTLLEPLPEPHPIEQPPVTTTTTESFKQPGLNLMKDFQLEIQRNKFLVTSRVLKKAQPILKKLQLTLSKVLIKCSKHSIKSDLSTTEICEKSQKSVERDIMEFENIIELNKKYRNDSDSYLNLTAESLKMLNNFKVVMTSSSSDNFESPTETMDESPSELTFTIVSAPTDPNVDNQLPGGPTINETVFEKFQKIKLPSELEELIDQKMKNGSSDIFKLASLIKNAHNEEFFHLKSKFPYPVQKVIWDRKCHLMYKTLEGREFKLYVDRNQIGTTHLNHKKLHPRFYAGQNWNFIPVENADFFLIHNILQEIILGIVPKEYQVDEVEEEEIVMKSVKGLDLTMADAAFMWRLDLTKLECQQRIPTTTNANDILSEESKLVYNVQDEMLAQYSTPIEIVNLVKPLTGPGEIATTPMTMSSSKEEIKSDDDVEDCSESTFLSLFNKKFPHLMLNVNENGKVVVHNNVKSQNVSRLFVD